MRLITLGIAAAAATGFTTIAAAQEPAPAAPPPVVVAPHLPPVAPAPAAQPAPPPPPPPAAPYRRCSFMGGRYASIGTCALRVVPGQTSARLQVKIERNLPARLSEIVLIWRERESSGGVIHRISRRAIGDDPGSVAGTILSVPVPHAYCAPSARPFEVELVVEGGRNLGVIGRFTFPCG